MTAQCNDLHEVTARTIDAIKLIVEKHAPKKTVSESTTDKDKNKKPDYSPKNS